MKIKIILVLVSMNVMEDLDINKENLKKIYLNNRLSYKGERNTWLRQEREPYRASALGKYQDRE